ncbi:MAG TPA: hypothetical protein VM120_14125 [Bryobacteraceae bacterium]|nr:hypothetical protein [Bryobacteraceae bacterium]
MKRFLIAISIVGPLLAFAADVSAQVRAEVALRAAIEKETVKGDLKGAIEQYKKLAQGKDRGVAAKALVHMGQCYEKLGDADARKAYERVLREFADQPEAAAEARKFLAAKGARAGTGIVARLIANISGDQSYMGPLSNDRRYVAFTNKTGVFIHDLVSGEQRRLVAAMPPHEALFNARISPDGKQVAYERWPNTPGAPGYLCEIHVIGVDGLNPRRLAGGGDLRASVWTWSTDGRQLLASQNHKPDDPETGRILINMADGSQRGIGIGRMMEARFSPDGKYIAFTKRRGEGQGSDIVVVSVAGGADVKLTESVGHASNPVWTPDGKKLLFVSDWNAVDQLRTGAKTIELPVAWRNGASDMWSIGVERGKPAGPPEFVKERVDRIVDITPEGDCYYRTGTFSRDLHIASNQLWVLMNLFGEKKAAR